LGILIVGFALFWVGKEYVGFTKTFPVKQAVEEIQGTKVWDDGLSITPAVEGFYQRIKNSGLFLIFAGYPFYLIVRFLIWAIKTLKQE